jgi:hypothetical protein
LLRLETVYKPYSFWVNMAEALYQSLILFFLAYGKNVIRIQVSFGSGSTDPLY